MRERRNWRCVFSTAPEVLALLPRSDGGRTATAQLGRQWVSRHHALRAARVRSRCERSGGAGGALGRAGAWPGRGGARERGLEARGFWAGLADHRGGAGVGPAAADLLEGGMGGNLGRGRGQGGVCGSHALWATRRDAAGAGLPGYCPCLWDR